MGIEPARSIGISMSNTSTQDVIMTVSNESDTVTRIQLGEREIILMGTPMSPVRVWNRLPKQSVRKALIGMRRNRLGTLSVPYTERQLAADESEQGFQGEKGISSPCKPGSVLFSEKGRYELGCETRGRDEKGCRSCDRTEYPFFFQRPAGTDNLQRAWARSNFWNKMKLLASLISSVFSKEEVDAEEVEALKQKGALEDMMGELADYLPTVKSVLIDERDQFLATNIYKARGNKVLAVVGAGHMAGMVEWIRNLSENRVSDDLSEISKLPPKKFGSKILPWVIPVFILCIITAGFITSGVDLGCADAGYLDNSPTETLAALGALLALGHPLTILGSFLAAPITSMNPTIGVGMVSGIMEYFFRKPRVEDMEKLQDDATTLKGWYRNRISRVLLVFFFSSLGSSIGTFYALPRISLLLGGLKPVP